MVATRLREAPKLPYYYTVRNVYVRTACETYTDFVHLPLG
jgi:hypothetical protein